MKVLHVPENHTAANLAEQLLAVLDEWELAVNTLTAVTSDNAANVVKAVRDLGMLSVYRLYKLEKLD